MKPPYAYIAVEGLIGAGKTTLAKRLAAEWEARTVLEEFEDNPFLPKFYQDPQRHAFALELSFLAQRYHQLRHVGERSLFNPVTVADYSLGKSLVFAGATLAADEHALFRDLHTIMYAGLPKPELLLYLHLPMATVRERIRSRGRSYEQQITAAYLEQVQDRYLDHLRKLEGVRVIIMDINGKDLRQDAQAYAALLAHLTKCREPGLYREQLG
ncbi:MAG: deoxynucleoside kinase [Flavobacteriales bacterium]|nr:deoxynucleoside kinase [Flavobacteriales bacterium]MBP9079809.1 deoxynucleoside kinase [Flavobacteriales bacterium]